jgi:hypothetical protein
LIILLLFVLKCDLIVVMRSFRTIITGFIATITLVSLRGVTALAQVGGGIRSGVQSAHGADQPTELFGDGAIFTTVVNLMLFLVGAIAVIMIIIGGLRYVLSGGDASNVTAAKNTILYAIVGVIVAILAYAVVNYVVTSFAAGGSAGL